MIEKMYPVIASETKQSYHFEADYSSKSGDCFVAPLLAMTNYATLLFTSLLVQVVKIAGAIRESPLHYVNYFYH